MDSFSIYNFKPDYIKTPIQPPITYWSIDENGNKKEITKTEMINKKKPEI